MADCGSEGSEEKSEISFHLLNLQPLSLHLSANSGIPVEVKIKEY